MDMWLDGHARPEVTSVHSLLPIDNNTRQQFCYYQVDDAAVCIMRADYQAYSGPVVQLALAPLLPLVCMCMLQGGRAGVDDLAALDSTLHANLLAVKACPPDQVEHLGLTFAAEQQLFGKVRTWV